jgi:hypothetical protein
MMQVLNLTALQHGMDILKELVYDAQHNIPIRQPHRLSLPNVSEKKIKLKKMSMLSKVPSLIANFRRGYWANQSMEPNHSMDLGSFYDSNNGFESNPTKDGWRYPAVGRSVHGPMRVQGSLNHAQGSLNHNQRSLNHDQGSLNHNPASIATLNPNTPMLPCGSPQRPSAETTTVDNPLLGSPSLPITLPGDVPDIEMEAGQIAPDGEESRTHTEGGGGRKLAHLGEVQV